METNPALSLKDGIRSSYLADNLSAEELDAVVQIAKDVSFTAGEVVFQRSGKDKDLYIVLEGKAVINGTNNDFIARIKPGGVFGEISLIDDRPRSASVTAECDSRMAFIPASELKGLMEAQPEIGLKIVRNLACTLCERLRIANLQIEALLTGLDV